MKKTMIAACFALAASTSYAQPGHIADDVYVFIHGGPSNQYRITGRVRSGSAINILKKSSDGKFIQIRTSTGKVGWADANNVETGDSTLARMPKLESELEKNQSLISEQTTEIATLRSQLDMFESENSTYSGQLSKLQAEIKDLNHQIDNMDESNLMRWFTYGGMVALGGVLLGLLLPYFPKKKKRKDEWY
ncbi:MAG: TIGR04211 family SH3 domain-containing protein [Neptunomonas phycophila]|uniref:TIGR04211 family SH3 domain-containing protein n=1 Tax=Neptunomonas phycophila TaxID=1572645 RepID=UPI003B8BF67E